MTLTRPMLTMADVTRLLQISERTVRRYTVSGTLPGVKIGGSWRFTQEGLEEFIDTMEERTHRRGRRR